MFVETLATVLFAAAVLHTFVAGRISHLAQRFPEESFAGELIHFFGEIEVVFGLWAAVFIVVLSLWEGPAHAVEMLEGADFTEPAFVFVIMAMCSTRPVLQTARAAILRLSSLVASIFRLSPVFAELASILVFGCLAGSIITEPAAMTLCALLLHSMIDTKNERLLYGLLAVLFVNISVGGALTPYAAPPILMVAKAWGWDLPFMLHTLGWRAALICVVNTVLFLVLRKTLIRGGLRSLREASREEVTRSPIPAGLIAMHFAFLILVILSSHHAKVFVGLFLFFMGLVRASHKHQDDFRLRESLLVAFFLAGLIVFGPFQKWWLQPLLAHLSDFTLFLGATGLTAITDNAALTYLGSQVEGLSDSSKLALVSGALAGGGLTLIANAPNLAGASVLQERLPGGSVKAGRLLMSALLPTLVAMCVFWL